MATPSQPSNQSNQSSKVDITSLREDLKDVIANQGDYNNLLKDSIKNLGSMDKAYTNIMARISTMNSDTLNVKKLNQELSKLKQKEYVIDKERNDLFVKADQKSKDLVAKALTYNKTKKDQLDYLKKQGNLEAIALYTAEQAYQYAREQTDLGQEALDREKEVAKTVGFTGRLIGLMNKHLGVGKDLYGKIVQEAREGSTQTKTLVKLVGVMGLGLIAAGSAARKLAQGGIDKVQSGMKALGAEEGPITKIAGSFSGMLKNIPFVGGILAGMVDSFAMLLDFAVNAKSQIQEMGRQIGLSAQESLDLSNHYHNVAIASGKAYLNNKALLKTQIDMNKELGITNKISDANVQTAFELMKFAGVELDTVTKIEQISKITGKNQSNIAGAVMHQVNNFKKLTGVGFSFQGILKEVANLSGYLGLKLAKYPGEIIKSVVAAKGLGLELKQLDSMADGFLDVESSIQKEMEAQVLTGRDINLNRARELFLNNQLVEAGEELSKQLGTSEDFLKMNRYEANAFAEAMGMSRDQVADMLKQQEYMAAFGAGSVKELQKKVALMKEQGRAQEAINKLGSEESFNKLVAASATEDLSGFIEKIKESLAALVSNTKLADMVQNFIKFLSEPNNIVKLLNKIKDVFGTIVSVIGSVVGGIMRAINGLAGSWLGSVMGMGDFRIDEGMISMVEGAGANIKSFDMGNLVSSAPSIGDNAVKAQTAGTSAAAAPAAPQGFGGARPIVVHSTLQVGKDTLAKVTSESLSESGKGDRQRQLNPNGINQNTTG